LEELLQRGVTIAEGGRAAHPCITSNQQNSGLGRAGDALVGLWGAALSKPGGPSATIPLGPALPPLHGAQYLQI